MLLTINDYDCTESEFNIVTGPNDIVLRYCSVVVCIEVDRDSGTSKLKLTTTAVHVCISIVQVNYES